MAPARGHPGPAPRQQGTQHGPTGGAGWGAGGARPPLHCLWGGGPAARLRSLARGSGLRLRTARASPPARDCSSLSPRESSFPRPWGDVGQCAHLPGAHSLRSRGAQPQPPTPRFAFAVCDLDVTRGITHPSAWPFRVPPRCEGRPRCCVPSVGHCVCCCDHSCVCHA